MSEFATENTQINPGIRHLLETLEHEETHRGHSKKIWIAAAIAIFLHLIFLVFVAPKLTFSPEKHTRTEIVQISPQQLKEMKERLNTPRQKERAALLRQELRQEFKSKEAPKEAAMLGEFNQVVPKQMIAGPQAQAPRIGGGSGVQKSSSESMKQVEKKETHAGPVQKEISLASLGFGKKIPKPLAEEQKRQESKNQLAGPPGPKGPNVPVGRDDKNIERGNDNLLNAIESKFYSFFARLEEPIIQNWYFFVRQQERQVFQEIANLNARAGQELLSIVEFTIDRNGNFTRIVIVKQSGSPTFDQSIRQAVQKLGSIPNPPPELFQNDGTYSKQMGFYVIVPETSGFSSRPNVSW